MSPEGTAKPLPLTKEERETAMVFANRTLSASRGTYGRGMIDDQTLIARYEATLQTLESDRLLLAKLAADTPQFFNPLVAFEAQALRDRILAENHNG